MIQFRSSYQCREVTARLSDLIEGDLSDSRERVVESHLRQCATCRRTHEELLLTISLLNRLPKQVHRSALTHRPHSEDSD